MYEQSTNHISLIKLGLECHTQHKIIHDILMRYMTSHAASNMTHHEISAITSNIMIAKKH